MHRQNLIMITIVKWAKGVGMQNCDAATTLMGNNYVAIVTTPAAGGRMDVVKAAFILLVCGYPSELHHKAFAES